MPKSLEIFLINAFTNNRFEGNPAAVMFGDDLSDLQMQKIAGQISYSETAFLGKSSSADYRLRWLTPTSETNLCGHATIAAVHFLYEKEIIREFEDVRFETSSGILTCSVHQNEYRVNMPIYNISEFKEKKEELIAAYNIPVEIIDNNVPVFILSNNYVFIKIKTYNQLINYKPQIDPADIIHKKFTDISMYTTETLEKENSAYLRFFAPGIGIAEDPVTGSASTYLALILFKAGLVSESNLKKSITVEQGDHLEKKGRVKISYDADKKKLIMSGSAVTFLKGNIYL